MAKKAEEKNQTMEELFGELEEITDALEDDTLPLEEAFIKYQKGMELLKKCNDSVERVEKQLKILEEGE